MSRASKEREYKQCKQKFAELLKQKCNRRCADCGLKAPTWTSQWKVCDAAVFVCLRCAGQHRGLNVDNTFVQSATIDNWNIAKFKKFRAQGGGDNAAVNARYEAKLPKYSKPNESTEKSVLREFIIQKYMHKKWYSSKPKKVKKKNTSQPLLENKEKKEPKPSKKDEYEIEEKSEIMTVKNESFAPFPPKAPIDDLLSAAEMQSIAPKQSKSTGDDLFDDIFSNPNTSSMKTGDNKDSKQDIMNMFNVSGNTKNDGAGIHDTFNPDFINVPGLSHKTGASSNRANDYSLNRMRKWNQTGQYEYGARLKAQNNGNSSTAPFAYGAPYNCMTQNNGNVNTKANKQWNGFDDMGQNGNDSKSVIMQQYKQKPSDNFMTSIYGAPQYTNNNQYVNKNIYEPILGCRSATGTINVTNNDPFKNIGYKKNNDKPMNNNKPKAAFSTVTMGDDLFSEFKI